MELNRRKTRDLLLSFPLTREILFFIYQKKVYKRFVDKKITAILKGNRKLSEKRIDNLVVSLTSFPQRIAEVKYAVYSLLDQTVLPEKIILWLGENKFINKERDLPEELLGFKKYGLEIKWCEDIRSYTKLIPALKQYPNHYIVIADDDIYYKRKWLEKLWNEHLKYPDNVICHVAHKMLFKSKDILPYVLWKKCIKKGEGFKTFGCGVGGVLYHRRYLHNDIARSDLFLNLAPQADDIWFYFMAILNDNFVRVVEYPFIRTKYVDPYREYGLNSGYKLSTTNVDSNHNDIQIKKVVDYYQLDLYSLLNRVL